MTTDPPKHLPLCFFVRMLVGCLMAPSAQELKVAPWDKVTAFPLLLRSFRLSLTPSSQRRRLLSWMTESPSQNWVYNWWLACPFPCSLTGQTRGPSSLQCLLRMFSKPHNR